MTMQHATEGKFIADSSQGPCCNQRSGAKSESPEPQFPRTFIGCSISNMGSGLKRIGYMFAKQFYWYKLSRAQDFSGNLPWGLLGT